MLSGAAGRPLLELLIEASWAQPSPSSFAALCSPQVLLVEAAWDCSLFPYGGARGVPQELLIEASWEVTFALGRLVRDLAVPGTASLLDSREESTDLTLARF
uniref:Uncharacterized protein n=1 Tax=Knipowitschia caucasica TaxID=637954 RepID=A0AAV2JE91_KNICA